MKGQRSILLKLTFLLAVFFCPEISVVYSNYIIQPNGIEIPTGTHGEENNVILDFDFFDDEQFNPISQYIETVDLVYQIPDLQNCNLILWYPASVWQPPNN